VSPALDDLSVRIVVKTLQKFGFEYARTKGSHEFYRHPDGRGFTIPRHRTIKRGTLASILKQAGISRKEFLDAL
jgi:predicted RNA binding protein YcfA (HicA-like mRNA interferase family)